MCIYTHTHTHTHTHTFYSKSLLLIGSTSFIHLSIHLSTCMFLLFIYAIPFSLPLLLLLPPFLCVYGSYCYY
ncbi:hypothetical protein BY458DRAFT_512013 [Sporodiniella umbellata]|nr:hypothetical protein BY458DRAFT_512013 [Sporodiniella umbellata]